VWTSPAARAAPTKGREKGRNEEDGEGHLAEVGGEGDGLLGRGELGGVGVPRRHGADGQETRRPAAGAGAGARRVGGGGGGAAAGGERRRSRIREASTGRVESSGGSSGGAAEERRVREDEAQARSHVHVGPLCPCAGGEVLLLSRETSNESSPAQPSPIRFRMRAVWSMGSYSGPSARRH
jgi:hypothetical protein